MKSNKPSEAKLSPSIAALFDGKELTAASDNVLISMLADAAFEASRRSFTDSIDCGLVFLEALNEKGFCVHTKPNQKELSHCSICNGVHPV